MDAFTDLDSDKNILICMGYGPLQKLVQNKSDNCLNIFFHPLVSPEVLLKYTSSADFGVCFVEDSCLSYRYCLRINYLDI